MTKFTANVVDETRGLPLGLGLLGRGCRSGGGSSQWTMWNQSACAGEDVLKRRLKGIPEETGRKVPVITSH